MAPLIFFLWCCPSEVHLKQIKSDWFSLFPYYFNLFPNLSSPTFFHSHYPELVFFAWVSVFWCLSPPHFCWWAIFYFLPPWFALSFHSSSLHTIVTLIYSGSPLSLSPFLPFYFQLHWMFLSLTISFSSLWKLLMNNTMQCCLLIIDHLAAVQICNSLLNTCAIQCTLFLYNANKKGCILHWKYRKCREQIISYFESNMWHYNIGLKLILVYFLLVKQELYAGSSEVSKS